MRARLGEVNNIMVDATDVWESWHGRSRGRRVIGDRDDDLLQICSSIMWLDVALGPSHSTS